MKFASYFFFSSYAKSSIRAILEAGALYITAAAYILQMRLLAFDHLPELRLRRLRKHREVVGARPLNEQLALLAPLRGVPAHLLLEVLHVFLEECAPLGDIVLLLRISQDENRLRRELHRWIRSR